MSSSLAFWGIFNGAHLAAFPRITKIYVKGERAPEEYWATMNNCFFRIFMKSTFTFPLFHNFIFRFGKRIKFCAFWYPFWPILTQNIFLNIQYSPKLFILKYLKMGTKKRRILCLFQTELGTRYFFPGSLIAKSLFLDHGSLSLNR